VELRVRKLGRSLGVLLPDGVIQRLQTRDGQGLLLIEVAEGDYWLTRYDGAFKGKMAKVDEIMARYHNTLRALAK